MIVGQGSTSLRKQQQPNSLAQTVGYTKTKFAHKASAGDSVINLSSLVTPPEMSANGFINPSASQIASANILFYRNNLRLTSSLRGLLEDYISYTVSGSLQISFLGFTAQEGEIFTGIIDYNAQTGIAVANTTSAPVTYSLPSGQTDINIGQSFPTNKWPTANVGAVAVYKDGVLQNRNMDNSSVVMDGNYYEVDNGTGNFSVIRFNTSETYSTTVDVLPNGFVIEQGNGSMMSTIEALQGQVQNMAAVVASLAGQTETTVLGAAPSNVDLTSFGNRVFTLEQTRALISASNAWTAAQTFPAGTTITGFSAGTPKQYLVGTAYTNGTPALTSGQAGWTVVRGALLPYQTSDGAWRLRFNLTGTYTSSSIGSIGLNLSGVTFKNIASFYQAINGWFLVSNEIGCMCYVTPNSNSIQITTNGTTIASSEVIISGDVELDSKPTWAD